MRKRRREETYGTGGHREAGGVALLRVDHAELRDDLAARVGNDRKAKLRAALARANILDPLDMRVHIVAANAKKKPRGKREQKCEQKCERNVPGNCAENRSGNASAKRAKAAPDRAELHVALRELADVLGYSAELGRADGGEVRRVREEDACGVIEPCERGSTAGHTRQRLQGAAEDSGKKALNSHPSHRPSSRGA